YQDYDELLKDLRRACWAAGAELTQDPDDAPLEMATPGHGGTAMKLTIAAVLLLGAVGVGAWAMFFRGSGDGGPGNPGAAVQTPAGKVANPVFFPKARRIASPTEIKVSCDTPEAEIFYTIDKTIPTRKSGRWSGSLKIEPGATLRARAFCKGLDPSEIVEAVYARDTVVAAEVVRLRSQAEAAWKPLLKLSRNQGFGAKVDKCTRLYDQGEELYKMKAYADAKKRFSEVLRQCKTLNRDNSMRDLASIAQRKSDAATRDISDFSSSNVWKPIAKISAQAKSSFDRGDFVNAYKQWGQVVGEIDKRYKAMLPDARKKYETAINVPDIETLKKHGGVAWKSVETSAQQGAKFAASGKHAQAVIAYRRAVELLAPARTAASIAVAGARRDAAVKAIGDLIKKKQYYQAKAALGPMFKASPGDSKLQAYDKAISSAIEIKIYLKDGARDTKGGLQMPLRLIQAGTFRRGAPKSESGRGSDEKPHDVKISEPFYIGKTEVTYRQFEHFVKVTGYQTAPEKQKNLRSRVLSHNKLVMTTGGSWRKPGFVQGADHPVVCVSWNDAQAFCDWLTKRAGGMKVSLPSEAQWEYACRRGTTTRFSFGNDDTQLCKYGNYGDGSAPFPVASPVKNSDGKSTTAPVQSYKGANVTPHIYDMHGNVSEWCLDGYGIYQIDKTGKASVDPVAPRRLLYVIRGGSWASTPAKCRSAARGKMNGGWHSAIVGFRVVATGNPARVRR
ncbi:MAG: SUMF1/EgtB/PvdO family nonheme iron enzyme, partial [Phycisphaerales bacterium]|nr:SUMF1/EgtB/PvdO family nonheme iron enzyme [Phycisphaerales bacterium]